MLNRILTILLFCLYITNTAYARVGGGGGHSSSGSHSSSSHSSYSSSNSHSSDYNNSTYNNGDDGSSAGSDGTGAVFITIIIVFLVVVVIIATAKKKLPGSNVDNSPVLPTLPFPQGLDAQKVSTSFFAIQEAWSRKDLKEVRKWLSDGMYQRLTTQFAMMKKLDQVNVLNNIKISRIAPANTGTDNNYQTVDVAISFEMDDSFTSTKYPQFNESFLADADTEYWTFIKRTDSTGEKNLYDNANCPNCGAPFEVKIGEISRCSNCNTLTNSAAYDWVLSEITQAESYSGGAGMAGESTLSDLFRSDPFFAVQRMEDIASNVFMQVMQVFAGDDKKALSRFADEDTTNAIMQQKQSMGAFMFDRLYLDNVTLRTCHEEKDHVVLTFDITVNYRRVAVAGSQVQMIDKDFITQHCTLLLSRSKDVFTNPKIGETVYSYECSSCGAPFTDTTKDCCEYCGEPVVNKKKNWVLTGFEWGN